ncbi:fungal-specific transcription factor domain-containing protein [Cadophora sp. MPI-SDFR-AT-0126]|nr:fungal-specific transcription factor domain-containing protein [Leotiomycetes sp. MPI-SDFR-AT-0126]
MFTGSPQGATSYTGSQQVGSTTVGAGNSAKTISCTSCRQRKTKCDRVKPRCGNCVRAGYQCEFLERKKPAATQRRTLKMLEARLANVETQLVAGAQSMYLEEPTEQTIDIVGRNHLDGGTNIERQDPALLHLSSISIGGQSTNPLVPASQGPANELTDTGMQECLPPEDMINELNRLYFEKFHSSLPMIHKYRYYASMEKGPQTRPPVCLRYAIWATAASFSENYRSFEDLLYKRARQYIEADEMKPGEQFATLYHAQTWCLLSMYEVTKAYFSRSWMSVGRAICLVQKLGLSNLDIEDTRTKYLSLSALDWIELEEGRRTFWTAFYGDRWASTLTGWPMILDENKINTNIPASEESFEEGFPQETVSLSVARSRGGGRSLSPFGGLLLTTALYGYQHQHSHQADLDDHPRDFEIGQFGKRHRILDNVVSNTFMFLPEHLRLPAALRNMTVVFTHVSLHTLVILQHQIVIRHAISKELGAGVLGQGQARILTAAEEIANIMRLVSNQEASEMPSWVGFCLFVAARAFVKDDKSAPLQHSRLANIQFLISIMKTIGCQHPITNYFAAQLELEAQTAGLVLSSPTQRSDYMPEPDTFTSVTFNGSTYSTNNDRSLRSGIPTFPGVGTDFPASHNELTSRSFPKTSPEYGGGSHITTNERFSDSFW